ncbi:MAG TPA: hypothetical protein VFS76_15640 [Pyrinomonadaceae bacterium]|nr:hypothetical protein [Pyrinomonadaceae bacterium]
MVDLPGASGTEINLNSRSSRSVEVTPTFFTQRGEAFVGETFQMQPKEVKTVDLRTSMPKAVRNRKDLGGMTLEYQGGTFEMWAQLRLMRVNGGSSVDLVFSISQDRRSTIRNAVWWMPANTEATIALGNIGDSSLKAKATFANGDSHEVEIPAFGTQFIQRKSETLASINSAGNAEAVTLETLGSNTNLIAAGLVTSRDASFTSSIRFYDTSFVAQPNLYATNFRLKNVTPSLVLRNTGTETITTTPRFVPVSGNADNFIDLATVTLEPSEVVAVDLQPLKAAVDSKPDFDRVSVQVLNSGKPGSLIGALTGNDGTKKLTYDVPLRDSGGMRNSTGAYPWRVDQDLSTIVSITNISAIPSKVVVQINYEGGHYLLDPRPIAAGDTAVYDLRQIRDEQIPDRTGRTIPRSSKGGQFKWFIYGHGSGRLIGRAEMISQAQRISSSYSCPGGNCPPEFSYAFFDNDNLFLSAGETGHVQVFEIWCDAYGCIGPMGAYVESWGQTNPLVATLFATGDQADILGISSGQMGFWANIGHDRWGWDGLNCYWLGWYVDSAQGTATVPTVNIKFNDTHVGGQTVNVIVGQQISLTTEPFPEDGAVTESEWTIPGGNSDRIANYTVNFNPNQSATSATVTNLTENSLNGTSVGFYWISEGDGRTVQYSAKINGKSVSRSVTFNVKRPTVTLMATTGSTTNTAFDSVLRTQVLQLGNPDGTPGIVFTRTITAMPSGFSGDMQWVQVYNHLNGSLTISGNTQNVQTCGLDDVFPYPLDPGATQNNLKTSDSPAVILPSGATAASANYHATMWLLFKPTGVDGTSIWVPLRKVTWAWTASATFNGTAWTISSQTNPANLQSANSHDHPTWNKNINSGQTCP